MTSKNTKGAQAELVAAIWLMERGYDVFRNMSPSGPVDLIAMNRDTGKLLKVDVKSCNKPHITRDGRRSWPLLKAAKREDIHILFVGGGQVVGFKRRIERGVEDYDPLF